MLDQLRRHASSWLIKGVLALIILSFIFFFGYTQLSSRRTDSRLYVASVAGRAIPRRKFESFFQGTMQTFRKNIQGELPANLEDIMRQNVLSQMVNRELTLLYGEKLGLTVSDQELAEEIRSNKSLFPDGKFDLKKYQEAFLPNYERQTGENFEAGVRRDLLVEKTQALLPILFGPWTKELEEGLKESQAKYPKKEAKEKSESEPPTLASGSLNSFGLFYPWLNQLQLNSKVEIYR